MAFRLKHPRADTVATVKHASRRDVLLSRGWSLVDESPATPAASANKAEWVDHAVSQGADRSDAEAMTKAELLEQYG